MKIRVFNISFCIYLLAAWMSYPTLAQVGSPQGPSIPSSPSAPPSLSAPQAPPPNPFQTGFTSTQGSQPSNPSPQSQQGITNTQGAGTPQTPLNLQNMTPQQIQNLMQQQNNQNTTSPQPSNTPAPQAQEAGQLSSIENTFQEVLSTYQKMVLTHAPAGEGMSLEGIHQFGYSVFNRNVSTFAPVEDVPVGPDYVLGPGDELQITIWGAMEDMFTRAIDRYGRIYLPTIGPVRVWGLTFSQAEKLILAHISHYYKGFQASVTMGHLRTIKVYIVGEVSQPGAYNISALSTLSNALTAAGGPSKMGSLRNIELKRNHHTVVSFDFYDFLLNGDKSHDSRVEAGDVIFVPPIGPVTGIIGQIKRPAIYELKGPSHINDFIKMAGGQTPQSYLKHVQVIRVKPNAEREVIDLDLTKGGETTSKGKELQNGDMVIIYPTDPRIYNTISIAGSVKYPGDYEIKPGMRLSQILSPESLLPDAYWNNIEIVRFKEDLTSEVIRVNLKKLWGGDQTQDIALLPRDQIAVRSEFKGRENVVLDGEFKRPGTYSVEIGEHIISVIKRAGGFTDKAYLKGAIFTRKAVQDKEKEMLDKFVKQQQESLLSEEKTFFSASPQSSDIHQLKIAQMREQLQLIASRVILGRIVIHLDEFEKFEGSESDLILQDGDSLTVPRTPAEVMVIGSVRNQTSIVYKKGENIQYYLNHGGGFSKSADKKEVYLLKADGSALVGFLKLRNVDAGDAIIVPPKATVRDYTWIKDIATITGQTFLSLGTLKIISGL